jgi:hypothetical protein
VQADELGGVGVVARQASRTLSMSSICTSA